MAKYVLLSFESDGDADNFVKQYQDGRVMIPVPHLKLEGQYSVVNNDTLSAQEGKHDTYVRGLYKQPTLFHDPVNCNKGKGVSFTRGAKYGWMVCAKCGRTTAGWAKGDCWYGALGKNLLPLSDEAPEYRGMGVPGNFWDDDLKKWIPYIEATPAIIVAKDQFGKPSEIMVNTPPAIMKEQAIERGHLEGSETPQA